MHVRVFPRSYNRFAQNGAQPDAAGYHGIRGLYCLVDVGGPELYGAVRVVSESDRRQYSLPTPPKWSWSMGHQSPFWTGLIADPARAS